MTDFGGRLRQAREQRGITLRQIAATTKISVSALEALERNDISKLPGGIFSRSFVRSYAVEIGLDPEQVVREFLERFHGEPPITPAVSTRAQAPKTAPRSQRHTPGLLLKLVAVSVPIVVGLVVYLALRDSPAVEQQALQAAAPSARTQPPAVAGPTPTPAPTTSSAATAPPLASQPAPMRAQELSPAAPVVSAPGTPAASAAPATAEGVRPMRLEMQASRPCWVTLAVDGRRVFSRVMKPGERPVLEVRDVVVIEVGDAGAFSFSIDGRPGRPLGRSGQVRTTRITRKTLARFLR